MYCDKHKNEEIDKPLMQSKSGGWFCPNVEKYASDGKPIYCRFRVAKGYAPQKRFVASIPD